MSYVACAHKTIKDHSRTNGDQRIWTCSHCKKQDVWSDSWGYFGTIECVKCWTAQIDFVFCSNACRDALGGKHEINTDGPLPKKTKTKRLTAKERDAQQRAEIAANRKALDDAEDERHINAGPPQGCGDNSCDVEAPRGMATNGGCRCTVFKARYALRWYRYEYNHRERLDAKRREMEAKVSGEQQ